MGMDWDFFYQQKQCFIYNYVIEYLTEKNKLKIKPGVLLSILNRSSNLQFFFSHFIIT